MVQVIQGLIVLFVAAPRIITWLKNHTEANQEDAQKEPVKAIPRLLIAVFGLASVFIGLGSARTILATGALEPIVALSAFSMIIVAVIGVLVFIAEYSKSPLSQSLLLITAIGWLFAGVVYVVGSGVIELTSFIVGGLSLLFWIMMRMLAEKFADGGDSQ
jgi:hypothetical protein